jgi:transmembrane sensor
MTVKNIDNILARYFGGTASDSDKLMLEQWLAESAANEVYFDEMTKLHEHLGLQSRAVPKPNTAEAKKTFLAHIAKSETSKQVIEFKQRSIFKHWMFRAASIAIFVILSFSVWKFYFAEHEIVVATQTEAKQNQLPDETQIALSKNSKITYSSNFGKKLKTLKLEGEANFTVGHAGKGTLQVQAEETFIEDIGTVFSVTAYPDSNYISVKVREGQVHFYTKNNNGLTISANETGIYDKQAKNFKVLAQKLDTLKVGSMHVEFQAMVLKDAISIISNAYKVNIKLSEESIGNRKITVNFDGEDVNIILQIIAETLDLELKKSDASYLLSNKKNKLSE